MPSQLRIVEKILSYIKSILHEVCTVSLALDCGNDESNKCMDVRIQCFCKKKIKNLHLVARSMTQKHAGLCTHELISMVLVVLSKLEKSFTWHIVNDASNMMRLLNRLTEQPI